MARRDLLTDDERRLLFGVPTDRDRLARLYTMGTAELALVKARRRSENRLGVALQPALLRHPGIALQNVQSWPDELVGYLATQLGVEASAIGEYAHRSQTLTDHGRELSEGLGLRPPATSDLPMMIEAAAQAAWSRGGAGNTGSAA